MYDHGGILWLGTGRAGLNRVAARQNHFTIWQHIADDPTTLAANRVTTPTGANGMLWVGTGGVLNRLHLSGGQLTQDDTPVASVNQAGGSEPTNTITSY